MTERERLVELCDTMTKMCRLQACGFCKYKSFKPCCVSEAIADTMISNGVMIAHKSGTWARNFYGCENYVIGNIHDNPEILKGGGDNG